MKKALTIIFAAALSLMVSACVEDIQKENGAEEGALITETVTASVSEGGTKATISNAASDNFSWTITTDKIAVHTTGSGYVTSTGASATAATASFTVTYSGERDAFAIYPSTIVAAAATNYGQSGASLDVTLPSEYTLASVSGTTTPCPMIATNVPGSGWTFKHLCGLVRLTINNIPTGTSYLKVDFNGRKVSGTFSIAAGVTPGTSTIASIAGMKGTDDFIKITGISSETSVVVNIPLPTGEPYSDVIVSAWNSSDVALKGQVTPFSASASRARGKKLTSSLDKGVFSIAAGKYAVFSPGNLQAKTTDGGTTWTWQFAANQYDMVGDNPGNTTITGNGTNSSTSPVDLFGWSTAANYFGIHNSTNEADYSGVFVDWGTNPISAYAANTWRTPTGGDTGELNYVIFDREDAISKRGMGAAAVNGVSGLIILPDIFTDPMKNGGDKAFKNMNHTFPHYNDNVYSLEGWNDMEAAGAIFLPCTEGFRNGTTVIGGGTVGSYFANSAYFEFDLGSSAIDIGGIGEGKHQGCSVRLIREL